MNAARAKPKDTARVSLFISKAKVSQTYCKINFFYYMYGSGLGILRMLVQPTGGDKKEVLCY